MTSPRGDLVLGFDFGTSAVKAALFTAAGEVVARASAGYSLSLPAPGWAEQRPGDWWSAMRATTAALLASGVAASRVAAIGVAAQMCGLVPVDAGGTPLHNALIWLDTRSEALARRIFGSRFGIDGYAPLALLRWLFLTRGAPNLSGRDPTTKMLWLRAERPELWRRTAKLLDVKDYLVHRLTGRFVTSPDTAHLTWLMDARPGRGCWSDTLLRRLGIDRALLPEIDRATAQAGGLTADAAAALGLAPALPVAVGLGDVSAAALGAGTLAPGATHLCVGTSAWFGAHLPRPRVDPFTKVGSISAASGSGYLLIAAQETAGASMAWAARTLGFEGDLAAIERLAVSVPPSADAPYFLPWLYGERVPVDDAALRGGFLNLSMAHGRGEIVRALYEGTALNLRWAMRATDRLTGRAGTPLRLVGGGANSQLWCEVLADVLQRPIERMEAPELSGARGAAMTAAVAAGWHGDLAPALAMARIERSFLPDRRMAAFHAARFAGFLAAHRHLRPWYRRRQWLDMPHPYPTNAPVPSAVAHGAGREP
jgi:xylulokinase